MDLVNIFRKWVLGLRMTISQSMSVSLFVCHNMPISKLHLNDSNYLNLFVLVIMVRISVFVHLTKCVHYCLISTVLKWDIWWPSETTVRSKLLPILMCAHLIIHLTGLFVWVTYQLCSLLYSMFIFLPVFSVVRCFVLLGPLLASLLMSLGAFEEKPPPSWWYQREKERHGAATAACS